MAYAGFCQRGSCPFSEEPKGSENPGPGVSLQEIFQTSWLAIAVENLTRRRRGKTETSRLITRIILASVVNTSSRRRRHMMMILLRKIHVCWSENLFLRLKTWICNFWFSKYVIPTNLTAPLSLLLFLFGIDRLQAGSAGS